MKWQHESAESAARLERPPHVRSSDCQWRNLAVQLQHVATPSLFVRFNLVVRILIRDIWPNFLHQLQYMIISCSQQQTNIIIVRSNLKSYLFNGLCISALSDPIEFFFEKKRISAKCSLSKLAAPPQLNNFKF